jgi:hypothetical protein
LIFNTILIFCFFIHLWGSCAATRRLEERKPEGCGRLGENGSYCVLFRFKVENDTSLEMRRLYGALLNKCGVISGRAGKEKSPFRGCFLE